MKRANSEIGLSLIETIAVVGLISLVVLFTLGLIPSFKISNRRANMELQAGNLAQSHLDDQRSRRFSSVVSVPATDIPLDNITYRLEVIVTDGASGNTKRVRILVTWRWKERDFSTFRESVICNIPR
jgi:type II secretory pathway pseudopilin PulG